MSSGNHSRISTACDYIDINLAEDMCAFALEFC